MDQSQLHKFIKYPIKDMYNFPAGIDDDFFLFEFSEFVSLLEESYKNEMKYKNFLQTKFMSFLIIQNNIFIFIIFTHF